MASRPRQSSPRMSEATSHDRDEAEGGGDGLERVRPPPQQRREQRQRDRHGQRPPHQVLPERSLEHHHGHQRRDERPVPPDPPGRIGNAGLGPQRTSRVPEHDPTLRKSASRRIGRKYETATVRSAGVEWPESRCGERRTSRPWAHAHVSSNPTPNVTPRPGRRLVLRSPDQGHRALARRLRRHLRRSWRGRLAVQRQRPGARLRQRRRVRRAG